MLPLGADSFGHDATRAPVMKCTFYSQNFILSISGWGRGGTYIRG